MTPQEAPHLAPHRRADAGRLLIIETAAPSGLADYLAGKGYRVETAPRWRGSDCDLVISDSVTELEGRAGWCVHPDGPAVILRRPPDAPLSGVEVLELGFDDCVEETCTPREMLARVRAILRRRARSREARAEGARRYLFAGCRLEVASQTLFDARGRRILLTSGQFVLLRAFLEHPGAVLTREELVRLTQGDEAQVFDRAVDVHVSRLRQRLLYAGAADVIRTLRGSGYMLDAAVERPLGA